VRRSLGKPGSGTPTDTFDAGFSANEDLRLGRRLRGVPRGPHRTRPAVLFARRME
jgi:hypothetical protein